MYRNNRTLLALFVMILAVAASADARCKRNPSGKPWETNVVLLKFEGCAAAEPTAPFDLKVGTDTVRFEKHPVLTGYWHGQRSSKMAIGSRAVTIPPTDLNLPVPTQCTGVSEEFEAGDCVALFRIACEEMWLLSVNTDPPDAPAVIRYQRPPVPDIFAACELAPETPEGPADLQLRKSELVGIQVENLPAGPVTLRLSFRDFRLKSTLRLRDLPVQAVSSEAAVSTNRAVKALKKRQVRLVLKDLLFTRQ